MATINFTAWAPGVWADGVWALGAWEGELAGGTTGQTYYDNGRRARGQDDDPALIERAVREKWEAVELAQARELPEQTRPTDDEEDQPKPQPVVAGAPTVRIMAGGPLDVAMPEALQPRMTKVSAPVPVAPSQELLIRQAMERDDEDALMLILAQL